MIRLFIGSCLLWGCLFNIAFVYDLPGGSGEDAPEKDDKGSWAGYILKADSDYPKDGVPPCPDDFKGGLKP